MTRWRVKRGTITRLRYKMVTIQDDDIKGSEEKTTRLKGYS